MGYRHNHEAGVTANGKALPVGGKTGLPKKGTIEWEDRPVNRAGESFYVRGVTVATTRWGKITASTVYIFDPSVLPGIWGE
jgi:ketosteroid isomerase-like protein